MIRMRNAWLVPILGLAVASTAHAQRDIAHRAAASRDGVVRIHNLVGSVRVTGWDRDSIVVTGSVREPKGEPFGFHVGDGGAKLGIWDAAGGTDLGPSHLDVRVPAASTVWVKTASADVVVDGVTGGVDVNAVSGRIEVSGRPSEIYAESLGGEVRITADTRFARARTATGPITVSGRIADASVITVGGDMSIEGGAFERGRFESVDGNIRYAGTIGPKATLDFVSHAGSITFTLPRTAAAEFTVHTYEGGFEDRFGVSARTPGSQLKGQETWFRVGQGGAGVVNVRSFKGRVVLGTK